jgi:hypothetical protein
VIIKTKKGDVRACLLIPTRGRSELVLKQLSKMESSWNRSGVYFCIEKSEVKKYRKALQRLPKAEMIVIPTQKTPIIGNALESLRSHAVGRGVYDYYVFADDNCMFTREAFNCLVRACHEWGKPVHMCGFHGTAKHFDARKIRTQLKNKLGLDTYPKFGWIFRCVPHAMVQNFCWPTDRVPCYSDRYHTAYLLSKGFFEFRACVQSPFTKKRFVAGGIGERSDRRTTATGLAQLAGDFPQIFGPHEVRIPWTDMVNYCRDKAAK